MNKEEKLEQLKNAPTKQNADSYIIAFIEEYTGYAGYYEYFSSYGSPVKVRYRGIYKNFKYKGTDKDGTFEFDVTCTCIVDTDGYSFNNEEKFIASLYDEIKERSEEDIKNAIVKEIVDSVTPYDDDDWFDFEKEHKPFYDFGEIKLKLNRTFKYKVE